MPVYEYGCTGGHHFEVKQKFSDTPLTTCQVCNLPVTKLISAPSISFKGSGWYITDYSDKMKPPATGEKPGQPTDSKPPPSESKKDGAEKSAAAPLPATSTSAPASGSATGSGSTPAAQSGS